jgi:hypothetical protein
MLVPSEVHAHREFRYGIHDTEIPCRTYVWGHGAGLLGKPYFAGRQARLRPQVAARRSPRHGASMRSGFILTVAGEYESSRGFLTRADQGPLAHPARSPARPRTIPLSPSFLGVVQFSVCLFSACTFPAFPGEVENCHFGECRRCRRTLPT